MRLIHVATGNAKDFTSVLLREHTVSIEDSLCIYCSSEPCLCKPRSGVGAPKAHLRLCSLGREPVGEDVFSVDSPEGATEPEL